MRLGRACGRRLAGVSVAFVVMCTAALRTAPVSARPSAQLPDGPGKAEMEKVCGACHDAVQAASLRLTEEGWSGVVANMKDRGAEGTDQEFAAVLKYLVTNFHGEAVQPLNINTATAIDLETVGELTRRESAAVRAWLEKSGPRKKLEDLRNVEGLDYKKIEAHKEFMVCF